MNPSVKKGMSFGLTTGVITTLGLMIGLTSGSGMKKVVLAGVLTIAIADAFSDALGIHISEESDESKTQKDVWSATIATFVGKLIFGLTFAIPVIFLSLNTAVIVSIVWGVSLLTMMSYQMAKAQKTKTWSVIGEHLLIAGVVLVATHYIGFAINYLLI